MMKKLALTFLMLTITSGGMIRASGEGPVTLTEEQMTAYRTQPAVPLIYSGMFVEVALKSGQTFRLPEYGSGSSFFIHPDGYLITNGHVVQGYVDYKRNPDEYAGKVLRNFVVNKVAGEFRRSRGRNPGQKELTALYKKYFNTYEPRVSNHGAINYVVMSNSETLRFEVKKHSPSITEGGKDIAVIKVERENCPVLKLGDSSRLVLQQKVYTIGYPAVVDPQRFPLLGQENTLKSSVTGGAITALKTDLKGMSVIQYDAATSPGNSGGPTVNASGRVVGVHSYAATEYDGFKFFVPINTAREFIQDAGIEVNQSSEFTDTFNALLDAVWTQKWFDARGHVMTALTYMEGEPNLKKLHQMIITRINQMGFLQKAWVRYKLVIILALVVLVLLVLVVLKLRAGEPGKAPSSKTEKPEDKTRVISPDQTVYQGQKRGLLEVLIQDRKVESHPLTDGPTVVGRDPDTAQVVIRDQVVSKNHLKIIPGDSGIQLVDLGSTNGTYIEGKRVKDRTVQSSTDVHLGIKGDIVLRIIPGGE